MCLPSTHAKMKQTTQRDADQKLDKQVASLSALHQNTENEDDVAVDDTAATQTMSEVIWRSWRCPSKTSERDLEV